MLIEEQIAERRLRARKENFQIRSRSRAIFGDYQVLSDASKRTYRVALRGLGIFDNYCACPDFAVNTLGTCKHIEAVILHARDRFGRKVEKTRYRRNHTTIYLDYGNTLNIRIALPSKISRELASLRDEFFDAKRTLRPAKLEHFSSALGRFRSLEDSVVIYADALEWIDRALESRE